MRAASTPELFEQLRSDYAAAKQSPYRRKRTGLVRSGTGHDYHYRRQLDFYGMIEDSRDMVRNDTIVGSTISRAVLNTVQSGFQNDVDTGDKVLDRDLDQRWQAEKDDADVMDVAGELTFADFEELSYFQEFMDGDVLLYPTEDDTLQYTEAHRIKTPGNTTRNVVHGVHMDDHRKRLEYWVTRDEIEPMRAVKRVGDMHRLPVRDEDGNRQLWHLYSLSLRRYSQTRGVTALAPIFDVLGMFEDIQFAELVRRQVISCFAIFRKRSHEFRGEGDQQKGARTDQTLRDGSRRRLEGIAPGMEIEGEIGEELEGFSPNIPGEGFFEHVRLILTLVGINLGMPLVLTLMDARETNFSGYRGAVDQARMGFKRNQQSRIRRFHTPFWRWKVRRWMETDPALRNAAARSDIDVFGHKWHGPRWPYIEPLKDASAALLRKRNGLAAAREICAETDNVDWERRSSWIVEDNGMAIRKALEQANAINDEFGLEGADRIHWRDVLSLPTPDGVKVAIGGGGGGQGQVNQEPDDQREAA